MTKAEDNQDLDALLVGLRVSDPQPSSALQARVLADAMAAQPKPSTPPRRTVAATRGRRLRALADLFGGGGALAGMGLAAATGLFVGIAQPAPVAALTQALVVGETLDSLDLLPAADGLWTED
ncbi:MAG: hypothetical protein ACRDBH_02710 [Bosea sp. (in: a-proteobacteria)]